jgi:uncharacterized YccA/Bax inhibitor family protein
MGNPALTAKAFSEYDSYAGGRAAVMTVQGAATKTLCLLGLLAVTGAAAWQMTASNPEAAVGYMFGAAIGGLVVALATVFKKTWSPVTAPIYAVLEGFLIGAISYTYQRQYAGIVPVALALTLGVFVIMLVLYKARILVATPAFVRGVVAATAGIALVYLASFVMRMFGLNFPFIHDTGMVGIGISVVIVGVAAFNLIIDFAVVEQGAAEGAPKYMEWYAAFGLLVTLVWLYLEILRLLAKTRRR